MVRYFFVCYFFFFSSRRRHTRCLSDWSSDVCSSDLSYGPIATGSLFGGSAGGAFFSRGGKAVSDAIGCKPIDPQAEIGRRRVGKECRARGGTYEYKDT